LELTESGLLYGCGSKASLGLRFNSTLSGGHYTDGPKLIRRNVTEAAISGAAIFIKGEFVPPLPPTASAPGFTCPQNSLFTNGTCVFTGDVIIDGAIVVEVVSIQVIGNMTMTDNSALSIIYPATISITGCASFQGTLQFNASQIPTNGSGTVVVDVIEYGCFAGNFTKVDVFANASSSDNCYEVVDSNPEYGSTKLSIVFTVELKESCKAEGPVVADETIAIAIGVTIGGVVLIALVVIILFATVPSLRKKIQPYRNRNENNTAGPQSEEMK